MKFIINLIAYNIFSIIKFFLTKNCIIIGTSSYYRYAGNSKYLYEFLCKNTSHNIFWLTESKTIMDYLDSKNYEYLNNKKFLKKLYYTLKCKIIIDSGTGYYDLFNLLSKDNNIIKISTMHGSGPKLSVERHNDITKSLNLIKKINTFNCVSFCTPYSQKIVGINQLFLPESKTKILGLPKLDLIMNEEYTNLISKNKKWVKKITGRNDVDFKVIYYTPTFRAHKSELPIFMLQNFNLNDFNNFLIKNNIIFIYSYHSLSNFTSEIINFSNIKFFDVADNNLFDNMELMIESDMMIGDYSTLATECSILKKPQLFVMPDYEYIKNTKGFAEDLRETLPGKEIQNYDDLKTYITLYLDDITEYRETYKDKINLLHKRFVGSFKKNSRQKFLSYIEKFLNNSA